MIEPEVRELLAGYRALLVEMHEARLETAGKPRRWNRLVDKVQQLQLQLRKSEAGRAGITDLALGGENETIRQWSAVNALAWDAARVRPVLEEQAKGVGLGAFDAKMTLREYDEGRLNTAWRPKGR